MTYPAFAAALILFSMLCPAPLCAQGLSYSDELRQINSREIPWGGLFDTLAVHPRTPSIVFAGSGIAGLFQSIDGGAHWRHVDAFPGPRVTYVSFFASDPTIMLVTTGFDTRMQRGGGIWRSTDGGATWSEPPTSIPPITSRCPERVSANGISWEPGTATVWVAADCGLMRSRDRGETWTQIIVDPTAAGAWDVWDGRFRPDRIFAVLAQDADHVIVGGESGFYYMHDGRTWRRSIGTGNNGYCARGLAASPNDPNLLFRADYDGGYLMYSMDRGITWQRFPQTGLEAGNMPPWVRTVALPGTTDFELYFGTGVGLKRAVIPRNQSSWPTLAFTDLAIAHSDILDLAFHPVTNRPMLIAGDG